MIVVPFHAMSAPSANAVSKSRSTRMPACMAPLRPSARLRAPHAIPQSQAYMRRIRSPLSPRTSSDLRDRAEIEPRAQRSQAWRPKVLPRINDAPGLRRQVAPERQLVERDGCGGTSTADGEEGVTAAELDGPPSAAPATFDDVRRGPTRFDEALDEARRGSTRLDEARRGSTRLDEVRRGPRPSGAAAARARRPFWAGGPSTTPDPSVACT